MKKKIDIFTWILTVFMFLAALMYFPSVASIFMLLFSAVALPVPVVRNFWAGKRLTGAVKIAVLVVLFLVGIYLAPTKPADEPKDDVDKVVENQQNEEEEEPSEPEEPEETEPEETTLNGKHTLPSGMEFQFWDEVRNDTTGRWRRAATSDSYVPADYALEYYQQMFSSDDEIHAIWNATLKTTTRISVSNGLLFVDTFEYVDGEEHDAKMLFTGTKMDSQIIDIATGEPYDPDAETAPAADQEPEETPAVSEPPAPAPEPAEPASSGTGPSGSSNNFNAYNNPEQQKTSSSYVLNTSTKKFHYPSCSDVSRIKESNYATSNSSRDSLISQGYSPCGRCDP